MSRIGHGTSTRRVLVVGIATLIVAFSVGLVASSAATPPPTSVHLHLGSDGRFFQYGSTVQNLTTQSNSCAINSAEPVMHLTSTGSNSAPGLNGTDIGVKSGSGANGSPCGQIDKTESLTLTPGTAIASRTFTGLRMDLEMTGNAVVKLKLANGSTSATYQLQTGTSITVPPDSTTPPYIVNSGPTDLIKSCAAPNSSGPNSGINDNCEWTVTPGFNFNAVTLTTVSVGTVSLEGSNDFGNNPAFDTVFYLSNHAPTPANDTVTTHVNAPATGNVLANDTDPDGDALSASLVSGPSHGTLTLGADGGFTYTPSLNYVGPDSFVYAASDGLASTNATANITVVDDPPVANNDTAQVDENSTTPINVTANDTDDDGPLPLTATNVQQLSPAGSTATPNSDGTVTFTPPANYTGAASFTYQAQDGAGAVSANTATVNVTVLPVICTNQTVSTADGSITGSFTRLTDGSPCKHFQLSASQADGTVLFQPSGSTATVSYRGVVTLAPDVATAGVVHSTIRYDPTGGFNFQPMPWCVAPQFDAAGNVTDATVPSPDTWCIASADTRPSSVGFTTTVFQIFGRDDPRNAH